MTHKRTQTQIGLPRLCKCCNKKFQPTGKKCRVCFKCIEENRRKSHEH